MTWKYGCIGTNVVLAANSFICIQKVDNTGRIKEDVKLNSKQ